MNNTPPTKAEIERALYARVGKQYQNVEGQLLKAVMNYLSYVMGLKVYRRNVGAMPRTDSRGKTRYVQFGEAGQSDVWAIGPGGVHIEVECKKPNAGAKSEPTRIQAAWLETAREAGAIACCVTSLEELVGALRIEFEQRGIVWKKGWTL